MQAKVAAYSKACMQPLNIHLDTILPDGLQNRYPNNTRAIRHYFIPECCQVSTHGIHVQQQGIFDKQAGRSLSLIVLQTQLWAAEFGGIAEAFWAAITANHTKTQNGMTCA